MAMAMARSRSRSEKRRVLTRQGGSRLSESPQVHKSRGTLGIRTPFTLGEWKRLMLEGRESHVGRMNRCKKKFNGGDCHEHLVDDEEDEEVSLDSGRREKKRSARVSHVCVHCSSLHKPGVSECREDLTSSILASSPAIQPIRPIAQLYSSRKSV